MRLLTGGFLVGALVLLALVGDRLTPWSSEEMDFESILQPPEPDWLRQLLVSDKGEGLLRPTGSTRGGSGAASTAPAPDAPAGEEELYDLLEEGSSSGSDEEEEAVPAGAPHWLGTDREGRDVLALLAAGARTALLPGLLTCLVALGLGVPLGLLAGYYGGRLSRAIDFVAGGILSLPRLVIVLVFICAFAPNVYLTMAVLGVTLIPRVSELIAARVRILKNSGFVLAAREGGLSDGRIIARHLFWYQNRSVVLIQFSLIMAESVLVETTLSYLRFGAKPPQISWGSVIEGSQMTFFSGIYWITAFPAAAIILSILGFFYVGDGLNAMVADREGR